MILKDSVADRAYQHKHQVMWSKDLSQVLTGSSKGEGHKTFLLHLKFYEHIDLYHEETEEV